MTTPPTPPMSVSSLPDVHRFSVETFVSLIASGAIDDDDRVELVQGVICDMNPTYPPHEYALSSLDAAFDGVTLSGCYLRCQLSLKLSESVLVPDLAIVQGTRATYAQRYPTGSECLLVIEISASSLVRDRVDKLRDYAGASIPEYWIVNLQDDCVEIYSRPDPIKLTYTQKQMIPHGETVALGEFANHQSINTADFLP